MAKNVAWYFNVAKWRPSRDEWLKLTSSIAAEDLSRINRFVYKDDSKASLVGSALIREFLKFATGLKSSEISLTKSQYGRPIICEEFKRSNCERIPEVIDFNVSHSGDYCILAGVWSDTKLPKITVGADVTEIVKKKTKNELDRFLDLMSRREFTKSEWDIVKGVSDYRQKCVNFTRLWCLKESYIKSTGLGMSFGLSRIDFRFDLSDDKKNKYYMTVEKLKKNIINTTTVLLDGVEVRDWLFFETALDDEHLVAIAYNLIDNDVESFLIEQNPFEEITIDSLTESLDSIYTSDEENWNLYSIKSYKQKT